MLSIVLFFNNSKRLIKLLFLNLINGVESGRIAYTFAQIVHHKVVYVKHFTSVCGNNLYMNISKSVGQNIKEARKFKGMTQKEVAKLFHMTQQQYSRFENGVFELNYQQIVDICKLLDTSPNEIFNFDN